MTEQDIEVVEESAPDNRNLLDALRRILMAGIGAAVLAQEEIEDFVANLVDRGEIAEGDGRLLVSDILERRKRAVQESTRRAGDSVDRRIEGVLKRLNVPTRSEISGLSEQLSELSDKVDQLNQLEQ